MGENSITCKLKLYKSLEITYFLGLNVFSLKRIWKKLIVLRTDSPLVNIRRNLKELFVLFEIKLAIFVQLYPASAHVKGH